LARPSRRFRPDEVERLAQPCLRTDYLTVNIALCSGAGSAPRTRMR
jgi:hypothetical protein